LFDIHGREQAFHDEWAESIEPSQVLVRETFEACTSPESQWLLSQMGDIRGKTLLDLGTGAGESAVYFALQGARVMATDLSPRMLDVVKEVAKHHNTTLETKVASAEDLSAFEDNSYDYVFGANVLHHVDMEQCLDEVKRVLKPGGVAAFWDPVHYNPVINVYRGMAELVRTEDEHPMKRGDIKKFTSRFRATRKRFFWLTTLVVFLKFYLVDRVHPNQDRYWKRVVAEGENLKGLYTPLARIDNVLLKLFPFLGWLGWTVAVVVKK
jgi:2-polyprenyl-3-methyl-5-hydroxy-6-metoxy-1,4-benzoquinol methylase